MSEHKMPGCCSLCDTPAFEILARWDEGEKRAGEPKRLGPPNPGTTRVTFMLMNGHITDMTFCGACAPALKSKDYTKLWRKNLAGWTREQNGKTEKFAHEFANGLLAEVKRTTWQELIQENEK